MSKKTTLILFEDNYSQGFYPISLAHPVFDLLVGCFNPIQRLQKALKPIQTILVCREYLAELTKKSYGLPVNQIKIEGDRVILINAAAKFESKYLEEFVAAKVDTALFNENRLVGANLSKASALKLGEAILELPSKGVNFGIDVIKIEISAVFYNHLWDLVNDNGAMITNDSTILAKGENWKITPKGKNHKGIFIHKSAQIAKGAYLDDALGPIVIDEKAVLEPRSVIQGPSYIGKGSRVMGGIVREGCSLGPVCKVGGELEESVILGYSNKCHEGFIGHAYLGEWVNLGAMTTNSDLKNIYSPVKVSLNGKEINTKSLKVGSFIGDHTKTGIGTLFNTGLVIGFCCNLYGGTLFIEREIPSFSWGTPGNLTQFKLEKAIEIAESAMSRRGQDFGEDHKALFAKICGNNWK
jgi:UDP-N-acetylglucosamine diphosphorylase / glucose-1-phosphate thymidylyltransferase / UDP-N-acetylgalactosamine diphosphorylase / glucosamine-1-phosphate N-acetyltransferase / galactosamine-1-phosphate N-acetyltransferase